MEQKVPKQWQRGPKPDKQVVETSLSAAKAAVEGQIRAVAIVTLNPLLQVEFACAGDIDEVRKNLLIAGLTRLIQQLAK